MFPEKPKNKAKRGANPRSRIALVMLLALVIIPAIIAYIFLNQPATLRLNDVTAVRIQHGWAGLSPVSPQNSRYTLTMIDGALHGSAEFSVGYGAAITPANIAIPAEVVTAFLEKLKEAKLTLGSYTPLIEWTDDYPRIVIQIDTASGVVEVYSQSQGAEHIPWGATVNGNDYTIDSGIPAQALAILQPYLHGDVLQELIDEALSPKPSSP